MSQQTMRQQARRDARTVTSKRRVALMARAKRLEDLAVLVVTALGERDMAVAAAEHRAGCALREMTAVEGATLREAVEWCGEKIALREAARLCRRQADHDHRAGPSVTPTAVETGLAYGGTAAPSKASAG